MVIDSVRVEHFKRVRTVEIDLADINVLVGGNNSGKSSVLQGIHFFVIAAVAQREAGQATFPQDALLFCPAADFTTLRSGGHFKNQSNFAFLNLDATSATGEAQDYRIRIYRGRNAGNVGCERKGSLSLGNLVASTDRLFSVYVPGLAGVPRSEEYRAEAVIRRGVASGDANLYLRNVLHLIDERGRLEQLVAWVQRIFPGFRISIDYDPRRHVHIGVTVSITGPNGRHFPLELAGTGLLQALQIFSYVTLFEPSLLLLDEPDAHLHPDNQGVLAAALQTVVSEADTRIILSTHSRHLVDALSGVGNFVWMRDGRVVEQGPQLERVALLMDLGALDTFDRLRADQIDNLILTEDADPRLLQIVAEQNGIDLNRALFWSYRTSGRFESALDISAFVRENAPNTRIIVHRDRDFLTDDEVQGLREKVEQTGARLFVTRGSDIESYFTEPSHCAELLGREQDEVEEWIDEVATAQHNALVRDFLRKRDDARLQLYKGRPTDAPDSRTLLGDEIPLPPLLRKGKSMLRAIRAGMFERFGAEPDLIVPTASLKDPDFPDAGRTQE